MSNIYLEAVQAYREHGTYAKAGTVLGIDPRTVKRRIQHFYHHPETAEMVRVSDGIGINPDTVTHYWAKVEDENGNAYSLFVKNNMSLSYEEMREDLVEVLSNYSPTYKPYVHEPNPEGYLLVIDPADIHIGKLAVKAETGGEDYDIETAQQRVLEGVKGLVTKAYNFGISHIVFVIGNDILHTDNANRTTTSGTPQDTSGMWWQGFLAAKKLYVDIIEYLTSIANVTVVYCPSNHDRVSGFMLADTIRSWFRLNPNVSFGPNDELISTKHRKYVIWGNDLIGFTHGDGAKEKFLPSLMQHEARLAWGTTTRGYWYVHHFHHKIVSKYGSQSASLTEKDHTGVTVINSSLSEEEISIEYIRSPSEPDSWHAKHGHISGAAIEAFLHHPERGQEVRITHWY